MNDIDIILGDSTLCREVIDNHLIDLTNEYYSVKGDKYTAIKIAAIRHLAERNAALEEVLREVAAAEEVLGKVLARAL